MSADPLERFIEANHAFASLHVRKTLLSYVLLARESNHLMMRWKPQAAGVADQYRRLRDNYLELARSARTILQGERP